MRFSFIYALLLLGFLSVQNTAHASDLGFPTDKACEYLSTIDGLGPYAGAIPGNPPNAGYRLMWGPSSLDDDYFCGSNYKDVGNPSASRLANNLSYYVRGTASAAKRLRVLANINQPENIKDTLDQFEHVIIVLYQKSLGREPSQEMINAIRTMTPSQWHDDGFLIEYQKSIWPTGKGFDLNFIIRDPEFALGL